MAESSPSRKMFAVMLDSAQQDLAALIDYRPWRRLNKCLNGRHGRLRSLESGDQTNMWTQTGCFYYKCSKN